MASILRIISLLAGIGAFAAALQADAGVLVGCIIIGLAAFALSKVCEREVR